MIIYKRNKRSPYEAAAFWWSTISEIEKQTAIYGTHIDASYYISVSNLYDFNIVDRDKLVRYYEKFITIYE